MRPKNDAYGDMPQKSPKNDAYNGDFTGIFVFGKMHCRFGSLGMVLGLLKGLCITTMIPKIIPEGWGYFLGGVGGFIPLDSYESWFLSLDLKLGEFNL